MEDAKEKLHRGDRDRAGGEETNNNNNNNDAIGLGEEEEELRRKQRRKEKKKLRRKMKAAQLAATKETKDKGELDERNDARETSAMAAATTTTGKLGSSAKDIDKSATVPANVMNRSVESFESFNSFGSVSDEEMDDANERVEDGGKQEEEIWVGHFGVEFSKKMATMRNNLVDTTELATTSMSSSSYNICISKNIATARRKRRRKRTKGSRVKRKRKIRAVLRPGIRLNQSHR